MPDKILARVFIPRRAVRFSEGDFHRSLEQKNLVDLELLTKLVLRLTLNPEEIVLVFMKGIHVSHPLKSGGLFCFSETQKPIRSGIFSL